MDEKTAWENFCKTGKITDYIKYTEVKNDTAFVNAVTNFDEKNARHNNDV